MDQILYLPFWYKYNIWMLPSVSNLWNLALILAEMSTDKIRPNEQDILH